MSSMFVSWVPESGRNLYGTMQQIAANGVKGDTWSVALGQWQASVPAADAKVVLTEGTGVHQGQYVGGTGKLGTYTGYVVKTVHDADQADRIVGLSINVLTDGGEQRPLHYGDLENLADEIRAELLANPVPAASLVDTGTILLSGGYTAPDNAAIYSAATAAAAAQTAAESADSKATTIGTDAAAAKTAAVSADGKLPATTATLLANCDVATSTRSSHSAADVKTAIDGLITTTVDLTTVMKTADYVAPNNAQIVAAATAATAAQTAAESIDGKVTATRAGYLDNLSAGPVATAAAVSNIVAAKRSRVIVPAEVEVPDVTDDSVAVIIFIYDETGALVDADSLPTVTVANAAGTPRNGNLGVVTKDATGTYSVSYAVATTHAAEQLNIFLNYDQAAQAFSDAVTWRVVDQTSSGGFTTTDRTALTAIVDKLPALSKITGTANATGHVDLDAAVGDATRFHASTTAAETAIAGVPALTRAELNSSPVPASNMRGTDGALLSTSYVAANNTVIASMAADVTATRTEAEGANVQATAAKTAAQSANGKLPADTATLLANCDVLTSTRSTFDPDAEPVDLRAGHGLATATQATAIEAKTNLLPTQPSAVADVPTTSQIAVQVQSVLAASHGAGAWDSTGDATAAKQDQMLAALALVVPPVTSDNFSVSAMRRWELGRDFDTPWASNQVTVGAASTQVFAMDLLEWLNAGTTVNTVTEVVIAAEDVGTADPVASEVAVAQDRTTIHFKATTPDVGVFHVKVTVVTTDGNVLVGNGWLKVE